MELNPFDIVGLFKSNPLFTGIGGFVLGMVLGIIIGFIIGWLKYYWPNRHQLKTFGDRFTKK